MFDDEEVQKASQTCRNGLEQPETATESQLKETRACDREETL